MPPSAQASDLLSAAANNYSSAARRSVAARSAAASVREGLVETLTVIRLGLPATFARTFATTNPIET